MVRVGELPLIFRQRLFNQSSVIRLKRHATAKKRQNRLFGPARQSALAKVGHHFAHLGSSFNCNKISLKNHNELFVRDP